MSTTQLDIETAAECWGSECYPIGFNAGYETYVMGIRPQRLRYYAEMLARNSLVGDSWVDPFARAFEDGYWCADEHAKEDEEG